MPWLFKCEHHRNVNVGSWSDISMHPVEQGLYCSGVVIHFICLSHPLHVYFHLVALNLGAVFSHSGYEKLIINKKEALEAGSIHHQLIYRYVVH